MLVTEFRSTFSRKQSDESPDTIRLYNPLSELPYLESKELFLTSSEVHIGSEAAFPYPR